MTSFSTRSAARVAAALLGAGLFGYVAARARIVPFTHDEAFTFNHWITSPVAKIVAFDGPERANNHLLNTLLAKASAAVFGTGELALRLPNVLAFAVYAVFAWLLLERLAPPLVALAAFAVAAANPLVLELFSLCRGYGLSLAFLAGGLVLTRRALERPSGGTEAAALAVVGVGAVAQLVLVDVFGALALVLGVRAACDPARRGLLRRLLPVSVATLATAAVVVPHVRLLARTNQLYAGGSAGFLQDSVTSAIRCSLMAASYADRARPLLLALVLLAAALAGWTAHELGARRPKTEGERAALGLVALPFLAAAAAVVATLFAGASSPKDRSTLPFIPLFAAALAISLAHVSRRGPRVAAGVHVASAAVLVLALAHLARVASTDRSFLWWFDTDDRRVVDDLTRLHGDRPVRLGVNWLFEPSLNFYRASRGLDWLAPVTRDAPLRDVDYAYLMPDDVPEALQRGWDPVARYAATGAVLARAPSR